jgi:LEA14-like dessication related protein
MKKLFSLLLIITTALTSLTAQQVNSNVNSTIQIFPYQQHNQIDGAIITMSSWGKNEWKELFAMLDQTDQDSLKLKATYALNAYVNAASLNKSQTVSTKNLLSKQLKKAKTAYAKIYITSQLALLTDAAIVDARNKALPAVPAYMAPKASNQNGVQQLLHLQDEMELSKNPIEQKRILAQVARIPGYSSFAFVSKFLANETINTDAASIITRLALSDASIKGASVRTALEAALPLIKGVDSAILVNKLKAHLKKLPYDNGFVSMFNGKDLTGWKGLVGNPIYRAKQSDSAMQLLQAKADAKIINDWVVKDGVLVFTGHGDNLCTQKKYGDFEMYVDWKITAEGDAGIYLRGAPQVQIWDTSRHEVGAQVGSGGLYNNQKNRSTPLVVADNKIGDWNNFHIIMKGDKVTVYLNGILVTDNVILENYWDRALPIFAKEQIELQAHGTYVAYRNIFIKEILNNEPVQISETEKKEGFVSLFDGLTLDQWKGNKTGYIVEDGAVVVNPEDGSGGNLYTNNEYANFVYRFEFQLTPGANNGIGIHAPPAGDAAYVGMEIQVLDNEAPIYKDLQVYQYHGSVYGVLPAKRGYLLPTGEWNKEEIMINGSKIKVTLNGVVINEGDIKEASKNGTLDHKEHPGLARTTGHIGFLGHGDVVRFKNMRIKTL